jgi:hypothetical protein
MEATVLPERTKTEKQNRNTVDRQKQTESHTNCSILWESTLWSHGTRKSHYIYVPKERQRKSVMRYEPRNLVHEEEYFHR